MTDDFEVRFQARLRARAAIASRPFDASAIVQQAVVVGTRTRGLGRLLWPSASTGRAWLVAGLLVIALLGAIAAAGGLVRNPLTPAAPASGWIAFQANEPHLKHMPSDIYIVREGVPPRRIVGSDGDLQREACPRFSPDGRRLAYAEARGDRTIGTPMWGERAVVIIGIDDDGTPTGSVDRIPVPGGSAEPCPQWSPDGTRLAYLRGDRPGTQVPGGIAITTLGGATSPAVLAPDEESWGGFAWSRDGSSIIAYAQTAVFRIPVDGSEPLVLRDDVVLNGLSLSPDGSRTVTVNVDASGCCSVVKVIGLVDARADVELGPGSGPPLWSPRDDRVLYIRDGSPEQVAIVLVDPDGTDPRVIPIRSLVGGNPTEELTGSPLWSPGGARILCIGCASDGGALSVSATGDPAPVGISTLVPGPFTAAGNFDWQPIDP